MKALYAILRVACVLVGLMAIAAGVFFFFNSEVGDPLQFIGFMGSASVLVGSLWLLDRVHKRLSSDNFYRLTAGTVQDKAYLFQDETGFPQWVSESNPGVVEKTRYRNGTVLGWRLHLQDPQHPNRTGWHEVEETAYHSATVNRPFPSP